VIAVMAMPPLSATASGIDRESLTQVIAMAEGAGAGGPDQPGGIDAAAEQSLGPASATGFVSASSDFFNERVMILQQTNTYRAEFGLPPLRLSVALHAIAQDWSVQQASASAMSHRPNFTSQYPSGWSSASENVAAGFRPESVVGAWMGSAGHRANLLSNSTHIGIGVAASSTGRLYYTQNFARYSTPQLEVPLTPPSGYSFYDVPPGRLFAKEIEWLASTGVTTGYPDFTFRPTATVSRAAMAAFLYRFAGQPSFTPPAVSPFSDITASTQFYKEMAWLASSEVATGFSDGSFRPVQSVNRDAMAAFLYRFAGEPAFTLPAESPFTDVTPSSRFYKEIVWLASTGITTGYPDGTFRPLQSVNRDAMAAFLFRFNAQGFGPGAL
jgi:hypothetical protein